MYYETINLIFKRCLDVFNCFVRNIQSCKQKRSSVKIYDDLYTFYVASKSNSISSAAKKMEVEQASLSASLIRLEKKLGVKLMIRKRTGLELTPDGHELFQKISHNYSDINSVLSELLGNNMEEQFDELKILTTTGALIQLLLNVIEKFHNDYPNTTLNLQTFEGPINFSNMNADIGILPVISAQENISKSKVITLKSQMFCSKNYIERHGLPQNIEDLKKHKFIGYYNSSMGYKGNVDWHLKYSYNGEADIKINLAAGQLLAAKKGMGIIAIPREIVDPEDFVVLFPEEYVLIDVFAFTKRDQASTKVDNFLQYIKRYLSTQECSS